MNMIAKEEEEEVVNVTEIDEPTQLRTLWVQPGVREINISRLIYTYSGTGILALLSNGVHLLWKWQRRESNISGRATAKAHPRLVQTASALFMTNDLVGAKGGGDVMPCLALTNNDSYLMSACGGKVSLFNVLTFRTMVSFMAPPPAVTCIAYHHQDNNVIAVGMEDSTLKIYNVRMDEVKNKLIGHTKRITGLAFSGALNILVSSDAESQIIVWSCNGWKKQRSIFLHISGGTPAEMSDTVVQFHHDQKRFLAVNETQLAIYDATRPESLKQWVVGESSAPISCATFSCDGQLVYSCFVDGTIRLFNGLNLELRCQINSSAYIPPNISAYLPPNVGSDAIYPITIAGTSQRTQPICSGTNVWPCSHL
ncbi:Protein TOPLESS [Melia azedarach]|uniref:Protein TOPLESS n=1 Tax=Melia azedarach TaxID=155640 RepID=A0ACC1XAR7_MELAZ|nr:Protein TOPLESS [Melia azedarach]